MVRSNRGYQEGLWSPYDDGKKTISPKEDKVIVPPPLKGANLRDRRSEIDISESPSLINAMIHRDSVGPRPGLTAVKTGLDSDVMGIFNWRKGANTIYNIVITKKSIYYSTDGTTFTRCNNLYTTGTITTHLGDPRVVHGSGTLWKTWPCTVAVGDHIVFSSTTAHIVSIDSNTQITIDADGVEVTGSAYYIDSSFGGDEDDLFWAVDLTDARWFVFCQGINPVMYLDGSDMTIVTHRLSADLGAAKFGMAFGDRLHVAYVSTSTTSDMYPYRHKWCVALDYDNWTGTGSGTKDWAEDAEAITGLSKLGDRGFVYKTSYIYPVERTGLSDAPFSFPSGIKGVGNYAPRSLVTILDKDYFVGKDNVYVFDGYTTNSIADKVRDTMLFGVHSSPSSIHGIHVKDLDQYRVTFPASGGTEGAFCWVYDYKVDLWMGYWGFSDTSNKFNSSGSFINPTSGAITYLVGVGTSLYKWDDTVYHDFTTDHFSFTWQIKDFISQELKENFLSRVCIDYIASTAASLAIDVSTDGGATFGTAVTITLDSASSGKLKRIYADFFTTSQVVGVRIVCAEGGLFKLVRVSLEGLSAGDIIG